MPPDVRASGGSCSLSYNVDRHIDRMDEGDAMHPANKVLVDSSDRSPASGLQSLPRFAEAPRSVFRGTHV